MARPPNAIFNAEVKYEFNKAELIEIIRKHTGLPDGVVELDISSKGQFRSISIKVIRSEIQG
jgi:putative lipoic acid-binding regulatory protein